MKVLKLTLIGLLAISISSCNNPKEKAETTTSAEKKENLTIDKTNYQINTETSVIHWRGSMIGVYAHEGDLKFKLGNLIMNNGKLVEGEFAVDMNSMVTTDDDALYKMAPREKLIGHLKAPDFFDTENFPVATFKITQVKGDEIIGDLTIKGKKNEEKLTNLKVQDNLFSGTLTFDRQKYGITYKNKMNDMVLSDDIELNIEVTVKK